MCSLCMGKSSHWEQKNDPPKAFATIPTFVASIFIKGRLGQPKRRPARNAGEGKVGLLQKKGASHGHSRGDAPLRQYEGVLRLYAATGGGPLLGRLFDGIGSAILRNLGFDAVAFLDRSLKLRFLVHSKPHFFP